jgi:hypothetical protein
MQETDSIKVVGRRRTGIEPNPVRAHERARKLQEHLDRIHPYPKPHGFVFKARTWQDYEAWRRRQDNPRFW